MFDLELTDEQKLVQETVSSFARGRDPAARTRLRRVGQHPRRTSSRKGFELGLVHSAVPEEHGGYGEERSAVTGAIVAEELGWGDLSIALHLLAPRLLAYPVLDLGSAAQQKQTSCRASRAEFYAATAAVVEPRFGLRPSDLATTRGAERRRLRPDRRQVLRAARGRVRALPRLRAARRRHRRVPRRARRRRAHGRRARAEHGHQGARDRPRSRSTPSSPGRGQARRRRSRTDASTARASRSAPSRSASRARRLRVRARLRQGAQGLRRRRSRRSRRSPSSSPRWRSRSTPPGCSLWEAAWLLDQGKRRDARVRPRQALRVERRRSRSPTTPSRSSAATATSATIPVELWLRNARGFSSFEGLAIV